MRWRQNHSYATERRIYETSPDQFPLISSQITVYQCDYWINSTPEVCLSKLPPSPPLLILSVISLFLKFPRIPSNCTNKHTHTLYPERCAVTLISGHPDAHPHIMTGDNSLWTETFNLMASESRSEPLFACCVRLCEGEMLLWSPCFLDIWMYLCTIIPLWMSGDRRTAGRLPAVSTKCTPSILPQSCDIYEPQLHNISFAWFVKPLRTASRLIQRWKGRFTTSPGGTSL